MVRSRGRVVRGRSRVVGSGSRVSGLVGFGFVFGVDGFTRVFDISDVSRVVIGNLVGDGLDTAIGQSNVVFAMSGISITSFGGSKVGSGVIISNSIGVVVSGGNIGVCWGSGVIRSWGIGGSSESGSQKGRKSNDDLKGKKKWLKFALR